MNLQFTHKNEGFDCAYCGATVPDAQGTCRNHCTHCLHSLHVDVYPGDRASKCHGVMAPVTVDFKGGLPAVLNFKCTKCSYTGKNKIADDDDREMIAKVMEKSAFL